MEQKTAAVSMRNITKSFGTTIANRQVSLDIRNGEILAILGENGSGKTTLMNMLSGIYFPDEGQIFVNGKEEVIRSPKDALNLGIGMVHQHFKLVDVLSATENIVLGLKEDGRLDLKAAAARIRSICEQYGFELNPEQKIYDMSVSQKQTVEIVKALYRSAGILILDEPTAVLTPQETDKLFAVLRNMRDDGKAVVIITHKLQEVKALSDRVAVLRKGEFVGEMVTADTSTQEMKFGIVVRVCTRRWNLEERSSASSTAKEDTMITLVRFTRSSWGFVMASIKINAASSDMYVNARSKFKSADKAAFRFDMY